MSRYLELDEQRIHLQRQVRAWTRSGLLDEAQGARLDADLRTELRRTGLMLRLGLAFFTAVVLVASVGLVFVTTDLRGQTSVAVLLAALGVLSIVGADRVVTTTRAYRHGVEEMLAMAGVGFLAFSPVLFTTGVFSSSGEEAGWMLAGAVGCAASLWVYRRFGFLYAPIVAMACAASVPAQLGDNRPLQRVLSAVVLAAAFGLARAMRVEPRDDRRRDERVVLQASALVGVYLTLNIQLVPGMSSSFYRDVAMVPWFHWGTYACTWLLPAAALWLGVREREHWLIDAGLAMALGSIVTNKAYLGWPRQPWDPMLLGVMLAAVALIGRRWLMRGPAGERAGFSPRPILKSDTEAVRLAGLASVAVHPASDAPPAPPPDSFDGGRSGGGGAGGSF